jgi:transposase InsO family protein
MPWKETCAMKERSRFVVEYGSGRFTMAELCRVFGISRETGYKWVERYDVEGPPGLQDRSRAPRHHPSAVPAEVEAVIRETRVAYPTWGPKKVRAWLQAHRPGRRWPVASTIGEILKRHGLTAARKKRRRTPPYTEPFAACAGPNTVWCIDFKGWFRTGDGTRCDPLTISDAHSRYLLRCQALTDTRYETVRPLLEAAFREFGLPGAIRSDNGVPFASRGIAGLSRLSVWWLRLEIVPERIDAGHPEQNGRHERMHRTLKAETASPPARTVRGQQRVFDRWRVCFNEDRPHEALGERTPAWAYRPSPRPYPDRLPPVEYPAGLVVRIVQKAGEFYWRTHRVFLGEAFGGEPIGLEPLDGRYWLVYYATVALGVFDAHRCRMLTAREVAKVAADGRFGRPFRSAPGPAEPSPQNPKVSTMCPV